MLRAMRTDRQPPDPLEAESSAAAEETGTSPLSLRRLREAFAAMLGTGGEERGARSEERVARSSEPGERAVPSPQPRAPGPDPCEINPRSVAEAMLFMGRPDNGTFSSREMAAAMRGCSPAEIDAAVAELNALYDRDG